MKQPQPHHKAGGADAERNWPKDVVRDREYGRDDPDHREDETYRDKRHKKVVQGALSLCQHFDGPAAPDVRSPDHGHPDNARENSSLREPRIHVL
jgi:hypothetical protein